MIRHNSLYSIFLGVILLTSLMVSVIQPVNAQNDDFRFKLVFLTSWDDCNFRNEHALKYYSSVTTQYLQMNGIKQPVGNLDCLTIEQFRSMESAGIFDDDKYDLVIIMLDFWKSRKSLAINNYNGIYYYYNDKPHLIISNSLTIFGEDRFATWTLSHELMHFIVGYKNYGWNYQEDYVHAIDEIYDTKCIMYTIKECPHVYAEIKSPVTNLPIQVMKPMEDPRPKTQPERPQTSEEPKIPVIITKLPTYFKSNIDSGTEYLVFDDKVCPSVQLLSSAGILANEKVVLKIKLVPKGYTGSELYDAVTTDKYGNYRECIEFGVPDHEKPTHVFITFSFRGNDELRRSLSNTYHFSLHESIGSIRAE